MEGYSVTEAASILGVPTERVWELLARGVLAGAAEGETGMRVYLQPRPAPAPPVVERARSNGDPGQREPERELSPFRELLTEFRNLTERYGQALLALGEARGEVAALRSRVDLLEARMDLRLPVGGGMPASTPWPAPTPEPARRPPVPEREAAHHEEDGPGDASDSGADDDRPSRRRRSGRHATESFAEALARAQDPTRPELPGAARAAAALDALRAQSVEEQAMTGAALPRELPAAEPMPAPDEAPAAQVAAEPEPEPVPNAMGIPAPHADASSEAPPPQPSPAERGAESPRPEAAEAATDMPAPPSPPMEAVEAGPQPTPIHFDPERYTVEIEEPDWYVEDETSAAETAAEPGGDDAAHAPEERKADEAAQAAEATMPWAGSAPGPAPVDPQESGADEMEVAGGSGGRPSSAGLPGSRELDEALAALDALAGRTPPSASVARPPPVADPVSGPAPSVTPATPWAPVPRASWPVVDRPATPTPAPTPAPTTPASRAYRRLRRIFPG